MSAVAPEEVTDSNDGPAVVSNGAVAVTGEGSVGSCGVSSAKLVVLLKLAEILCSVWGRWCVGTGRVLGELIGLGEAGCLALLDAIVGWRAWEKAALLLRVTGRILTRGVCIWLGY